MPPTNTQRGPLPYPNTGRMTITNFNASNTAVGTVTPTRLADINPLRSSIVVQNVGTVDVYLGPSSSVSATASSANRGLLLAGGQSPPAVYSDACLNGALYAIAASSGADLCVSETTPT